MDTPKKTNTILASNAKSVDLGILNLSRLIDLRLKLYFGKEKEKEIVTEIPMNAESESPLAQFIQNRKASFEEYIIILIALIPNVKVDFFDEIWKDHLQNLGDFLKIGGVRQNDSSIFLPTIETALFILAGNDLERRFEIQRIFSEAHWLFRDHILFLEPCKFAYPFSSSSIRMNAEFVELFTTGNIANPSFESNFPAQELKTKLEWSDLVLPKSTIEQIENLKKWLDHHDTLLTDWAMQNKIKSGHCALFYGVPGTGKVLTAGLLGKYTGLQVFKINLSILISNYIGETEKNLNQVFDKARGENWILFFDEADAIFGKRTEVKAISNRYANQEVSYLLQRIEEYNGLVILSTILRKNIDEIFIRRFQSIIHFPLPGPKERLQLWKNAIPKQIQLSKDLDINQLALKYELTGSQIINVIEYCSLQLLDNNSNILTERDLPERYPSRIY